MGGSDEFAGGNFTMLPTNAAKSIAATEDIRRGFVGLAVRPNAYRWKLVGEREVLAHDAERRVGVALTRVDGRSLELTSAGRYLADAARDADQLLADAEVAARWLDRTAARPVRLGLSFHDTIGPRLCLRAQPLALRDLERRVSRHLPDAACSPDLRPIP